jgi:hypothetical protein
MSSTTEVAVIKFSSWEKLHVYLSSLTDHLLLHTAPGFWGCGCPEGSLQHCQGSLQHCRGSKYASRRVSWQDGNSNKENCRTSKWQVGTSLLLASLITTVCFTPAVRRCGNPGGSLSVIALLQRRISLVRECPCRWQW